MLYQPVTEIIAFLRRNEFPKCHLNLFRLLYALHQAHTINQSDAMGICHNGWLAKDIAQNQIGTLTTHTRQFQQFLIECFRTFLIWNFDSTKLFDD